MRILRGEQERLVRNLMYSKYCELIENAEWRPMKEVAPIIRREIEINEQKSYAELGIRSFGKGTFHKPPLAGIEVGTKRLYAIKPKDLLFSNVFAWEGAIAVATANDDNRYGSHRFISCKTDENQAIPEFLWFHFLTEKGLEDINAASPGGAGRNKTLGLQKLEKIKVPIPPLSMQRDFIAIKTQLETLKIHQNTQLQAIEGLLPSMLDNVFKMVM